jgi:hypothetical protein
VDAHQNTPEELAAMELYHQLLNIGPDNGDRTVMVTLRLPNGRYVGDVWLSKQDVEALTDAAMGQAVMRDHMEATQPEPLLDVDAADINDLVAETEAFLKDGGIA